MKINKIMSQVKLTLSNPHVKETLLSSALQGAKPVNVKTVKTGGVYKYGYLIDSTKCTTDTYWQKVITDAARGKFLPGFYYDGINLTYKRKNPLTLSSQPLERAQQFVTYHQKYGAWSPKDMQNNNEFRTKYISEKEDMDPWKSIRTSGLRKIELLRNYVDTKYPHLPNDIKNEFITQIIVYLELKLLKPADIQFTNSEITAINGISANEHGVFPCREFNGAKIAKPKESKSKSTGSVHIDNWIKFLKGYITTLDAEILNKEMTAKAHINAIIGNGIDDDDDDESSYA